MEKADTGSDSLRELLLSNGLNEGCSLMVHSSFRYLREFFNQDDTAWFIDQFSRVTGPDGSLIMPSFTYSFMNKVNGYVRYDPFNSRSLTGFLTEAFRLTKGVKRTHSPTHSFLVKGSRIPEKYISEYPVSPLGRDSLICYFSGIQDSYILLAGCGFTSLTILHYAENIMDNSYTDINPWEHQNVQAETVCFDGIHEVEQIPGCSRGFSNLQDCIEENGPFDFVKEIADFIYLVKVKEFIPFTLQYLKNDPTGLLCEKGTCPACDSRRKKYD